MTPRHLPSPRGFLRRGWPVALVVLLLAGLAAISLAATGTDTLLGGQTLASGQTLGSLDGHYQLAMQTNGDLVLYLVSNGAQARVLWSTNTTGNPGAKAVLQADGDLIVKSTSGDTLWSSNTSSAGCTNLIVQEDGNLVLYGSTGAVWASHTLNTEMKSTGEELTEGQRIFSADDQYELTLESNGNLAVYGPTGYLWSTGTRNGAGNFAIFTTTGDLKVYSSAGTELWGAGVGANAGGNLVMQTDGNLVDYSPAGKAVWSSKTHGTRTPGAGEFHKAPFQSCPAPTPTPTPTTPTPTTPAPTPTPPTTTAPVTPTPVPAPSPVVTVPTPTKSPALARLRVRMELYWTFNRAHTELHLIVHRMPRRATIEIRCRGRGCAHRPARADGRHLKRLLKRLAARSFRAGDRVQITISERRFKTERVEILIRWGAKPRVRVR